MSWADAPVAGRRPCRWSSPITGTEHRMTPPRSAVTVSPSAPALARLTGFSRSGRSSSFSWLAAEGEALVRGLAPSLRLTAECGHPVDSRCTILPALVTRPPSHQPPDATQGVRRLLHVLRDRPASAFRALAGRPVRPLETGPLRVPPVLRSCVGLTIPPPVDGSQDQ